MSFEQSNLKEQYKISEFYKQVFKWNLVLFTEDKWLNYAYEDSLISIYILNVHVHYFMALPVRKS